MTHLIKTAFAGLAFAALSATSATAAIGSNAECEYEGGEVFNVEEGTVCMVPIRSAEFEGEAYDGQQLGISECTGTKINNDQWCKIVLVAAPKKETPVPVAEEAGEMVEEE